MNRKISVFLTLIFGTILFTGCVTTSRPTGEVPSMERQAMYRAIATEPRGNWYIGRRYYKQNMAIWGYVRSPGEPWHDAQMVLLNEDQKFAPDRTEGTIGSDDGYEYRLYGRFGGTIYEPASNSFYPEFILTDYEVINKTPPSIFSNNYIRDPSRNIIEKPQHVNPANFPVSTTAASIPPRNSPFTLQ